MPLAVIEIFHANLSMAEAYPRVHGDPGNLPIEAMVFNIFISSLASC